MKMSYKSLKNLILIFALTGSVHAAQVTLNWSPSIDPVNGYNVYYGTASGNYTGKIDAGTNTQLTLPDLQACQNYYFVVTAYDDSGDESPPSNEVIYLIPGLAMENFTGQSATLKIALLAGHSCQIQASADMQNWTEIGFFPSFSVDVIGEVFDSGAVNYPTRFYRTVQY
jgi:hypothetical protein